MSRALIFAALLAVSPAAAYAQDTQDNSVNSGGNFGIVTSFDFALHPVGPLVQLGLFFAAPENGTEALKFSRDYVDSLPDNATDRLPVPRFMKSWRTPERGSFPDRLQRCSIVAQRRKPDELPIRQCTTVLWPSAKSMVTLLTVRT